MGGNGFINKRKSSATPGRARPQRAHRHQLGLLLVLHVRPDHNELPRRGEFIVLSSLRAPWQASRGVPGQDSRTSEVLPLLVPVPVFAAAGPSLQLP